MVSKKVLPEIASLSLYEKPEFSLQITSKKSFIKFGAPILSFQPIISFGKNTANIHHEPSKTKLKINFLKYLKKKDISL